jgi:2',3'-cyclic-nucleotide 2'-phosphodiesterase (5'-nucleotidase family)
MGSKKPGNHRTRRTSAEGLVASVLVVVSVACAPRQQEVPRAASPQAQSPPIDITILHTNDIHGKFRDTPATGVEGSPPIGGFANVSAHVNRERASAPRTLLLDAGDVMTGNPICEYDYALVRGGALIDFMNRVGYDAMALGHHEFDFGPRNIDGMLSLARFPILSANTRRPDGSLSADEAFHVFDVEGLRVGVIGLTTEELGGIVDRASLAGAKVTPAVASARKIVREIDPQTDLIVLLTHVGVDGDRVLAREVDGVDVIVGGHSHTALREPLVENGVIIVQAGAHNRQLGRLKLTVSDDRVTAHEGELIELWPLDGGDPDVVRRVGEYSERIERDYGRVIGHLATAWRRSRSAESNVGNWICDRLREYVQSDFAIYNSGGIHKDIPAGPITRLDIFELLPFANLVAKFECTGKELALMLETNAKAAVSGEHSILQVSGIRYSYVTDARGARIVDATVAGRPVDPEAVYVGATVDYVVFSSPARYLGFDPSRKAAAGSLISDVIARAVEQSPGAIEARIDQRIRVAQ